MITTRRGFLRWIGAGAAATAVQWPRVEASNDLFLEPSRLEQDDDFIRLNSNENAYGPSPRVVEAIRSSIGNANRYPYKNYDWLTERIAQANHVGPDRLLLGCGSTDILRMAAFAFLGSDKQLIQASPTFEAIERYARATGAEVTSIPLTPTFAHDLNGMFAHVTTDTKLIYICNPNNPTASLTPRKDLEDFIGRMPESTTVLIDEAYHHYAGASGTYMSFIDRRPNDEKVVVARTFSKVYGLAGLRLGYAVGAPKIIQRMRMFATEDNVNALVIHAAAVALEDSEAVSDFVRRNADDRQEFFNQAMARGLKPIDSHANFVMMNTSHPAEEVIQHFRKNNILIGRRFPPMDTYIRVSLGRPEEQSAFWRTWDRLPFAKNSMPH